MRKTLQFAPVLLFMLLFGTASVSAETRLDGYFGMGTATVGATQEVIDFFDSGVGQATPSMDGVFGTVGLALMLKHSLGFGGQATFRFRQGDFAGLGYRPVFYDFNAIWTPELAKRVMPEFQAGLGGVSMRFYDQTTQYYDYNTGRYTSFLGSTRHFQLHAAAGLRFFISDRVFIRPALDYHWVKGFTWFKSNSVPSYSLSIGFTSGR
jgi:hypothetical protein